MTTLTLTRGQISPIIEIGKGTRVTSSGNGTIEYYPGALADAKNGGVFKSWPKGSAPGAIDAIRGMCIRATATGAMVVTLEEGRNDFSADGAYWDSEYAIGRGEIALFGASDVVASSVFSGSSLGTTLNWIGTGGPQGSVDGVIFDDTAGGVFDPASPARITIPVGSGITRANFTCGISIPAQATGERWIRLVQGGVGHMSSAVYPATTTPTVQNIQLNTGWIDVKEGQYFELHLVQNSGVSITVAAGSYSNKGGSTFFRASFK